MVAPRVADKMTAHFSSLKCQLGGLSILLLGALLYCLEDGELSLRTPDQRGHLLYQSADYLQAAERFNDPMWRGTALYRAGVS